MKMKKVYIIIGLILVTTLIGVYFQQQNKRIIHSDEISCINEWNNLYKLELTNPKEFTIIFQPGVISIGFKKDMSEQEIRDVINSNGLEIKSYTGGIKNVQVVVEKGKELEWVCKLTNNRKPKTVEEDAIIRYAEPASQPAPLP